MSNPIINLEGVPHVPHMDQYFGPWAIYGEAFNRLLDHVAGMNLAQHVATQMASGKSAGAGTKYEVDTNGIATIDIVGSITKYGSSLSQNPGSVALRSQIRAAGKDPAVKGIMLRVDSPGGTVAGTGDLADDIAAVAELKPTVAYIEDLGASAAYWLASQAGSVACSPSSIVGSIGTYTVMYDQSQQAAKDGVKCIVVRAGEHKGTGVPGTEITPAQITETQRVVDQLNAGFLQGIAKGRKMTTEQVAALNDGRVHVGAAAKSMGLVDAVQTFDQAMSDLTTKTKSQPAARAATFQKGKPMSTETPAAPVAATRDELKTIKGSTADFREACQDAGLTMAQAQAKMIDLLTADKTAATSRAETAEAEAKAAKIKPPGGPGITDKPKQGESKAEGEQSATEQFNAIVEGYVAKGMSRPDAHAKACRKHDDLRAAMVAEFQAGYVAPSRR